MVTHRGANTRSEIITDCHNKKIFLSAAGAVPDVMKDLVRYMVEHMKDKCLCAAILLVFLVCGCSSRQEPEYDCMLDCGIGDMPASAPDHVAGISYLPLDSSGNAVFRNIDKMLFENGLLYVADYRLSKVIAYTMQGQVAFVIDRKGRGPGEYLDVKSFTVDDKCLYILDNFNRKIFIYDSRDGEFVRSADIRFVAWDMEVTGCGDFIFAFTRAEHGHLYGDQPSGRVFITDSLFNVKENLLEYDGDDDYDIIGQLRYFSVNGDNIIYSSFGLDGLVIFDRCRPDARKYVGIKFPDPVPEHLRKDAAVLEKDYNYITDVPFGSGKYIILQVQDKSGMLVSCLYDKESGKFSVNPEHACRNYIWYPLAGYNGYFVSLLDSKSLYDELVASGFEKAGPDIETVISSGNPVLVFYEMET